MWGVVFTVSVVLRLLSITFKQMVQPQIQTILYKNGTTAYTSARQLDLFVLQMYVLIYTWCPYVGRCRLDLR
jgi:hypothetical protein